MPKEKGYNPVAAQRKAEKAKLIKKGTSSQAPQALMVSDEKHGNYETKAEETRRKSRELETKTNPPAGKSEAQDRRNERLAKKNPDQLQKQIDDLKKITDGGGKLSRHEEQVLEGLEKEIRAVKKARDTLGDKAPTFGRGGGWNKDGDPRRGGSNVLGKRRRDAEDADTSDEDVPEEVRRIPMPRDTPPPIPKEVLDGWYARRRAQRAARDGERQGGGRSNNSDNRKKEGEEKVKPVVESRTVYEAKPVTRNLQKEAVAAFVPSAVKSKLTKGSGQGGLMEPEEADALERQGYMASTTKKETGEETQTETVSRKVTMEEVDDEED